MTEQADGFSEPSEAGTLEEAARAAHERVERRLSHQANRPDPSEWQSAQAKQFADAGQLSQAQESEITFLRHRVAEMQRNVADLQEQIDKLTAPPSDGSRPPATQKCVCGRRRDCPHCLGEGWYVVADVTCPGCAGQGCTYCDEQGRFPQAVPPGEPRGAWSSKAAAHAAAKREAKAVYEDCARRGIKRLPRIVGPSDSPPPDQPSSGQTSSEWTTPSEFMNGYFASTRKWRFSDWLWALFWGQQMQNLFSGRQSNSGPPEKLGIHRRGLHWW